MGNPTIFDQKEYYEKNVAGLVSRLKNICTVGKIPFYFTACVENTEKGSAYRSEGNLCGSGGFKLTDDRITKHLNIENGFRTVPALKEMEINMDEVGF